MGVLSRINLSPRSVPHRDSGGGDLHWKRAGPTRRRKKILSQLLKI